MLVGGDPSAIIWNCKAGEHSWAAVMMKSIMDHKYQLFLIFRGMGMGGGGGYSRSWMLQKSIKEMKRQTSYYLFYFFKGDNASSENFQMSHALPSPCTHPCSWSLCNKYYDIRLPYLMKYVSSNDYPNK